MFQKCPICYGSGMMYEVNKQSQPCPTCNGKRIISEVTGKPPEQDEPYKTNVNLTYPGDVKFC